MKHQTIASWVLAYREAREISQYELADSIGVPRSTIGKIELGVNPKPLTVLKLMYPTATKEEKQQVIKLWEELARKELLEN